MQYRVGTVSVTNGSPTVTGDISFWLENIAAGHLFMIVGQGTTYQVGAVVSDVELTLTQNYAGATASGLSYTISSSFTPIYGFPYVEPGDVETTTINKRAMQMIEAKIAAIEAAL